MTLLEYNMTAVGMATIERAFRSIEGYAIAHNRKMQQLFGTGHSLGGIAANDPGSRVAGRAAGGASLERQLAKETAAFEKESQKWRNIQKRAADYQIKETLRAEREKTREVEREAKKRERIAEQEAKARIRAHEKTAKRNDELTRHAIRGSLGGAWNLLSSVGAIGTGLVGLSGGVIAANAMHGGLKLGAAATGLANQMAEAGTSAEDIQKKKGEIVKKVNAVRGASSMDALEAARAFGGISGNYDLGLSMAQDLTKVSLATDVNLADLSRLAGNAYMKIKKPGMTEAEARKQTLEAVRTFAGQGNIGAVEIKDLAEYGGRLTAAAAQFKGTRVENMAKMGTLAQVAVGSGSATDAAEATMAAARFASDITEHAKDVNKLTIGGKRVEAYTDPGVGKGKNTQFRRIDELVADIMEGTGGNMSKMKDIFGERSYKMAQGFQQIYLDAERNQKGSGRQAILDKFDEFMKSAVSEKDVESRAAARLNDADMQLEMAMKDLNAAVAKDLIPAFTKLLPAVEKLLPAIGDLAPAFADLLVQMKPLIEDFGDFLKLINKALGRESAGDAAEDLDFQRRRSKLEDDPYERVKKAQERLDQANEAYENAKPGWQAMFMSKEELVDGDWRSKTPEAHNRERALQVLQEARQNLREYQQNTKATQDLTTAVRENTRVQRGGKGTGAHVIPPRSEDGTPTPDV